jgi:hypothetical protein
LLLNLHRAGNQNSRRNSRRENLSVIASSDIGGTTLIHGSTPGQAAEEKQKLAELEQAETTKPPAEPPS